MNKTGSTLTSNFTVNPQGPLIGNEPRNDTLFMSQLSSSARMASPHFLLSSQTAPDCFSLTE